MTPAARIAAAIELLDSINKAPRKPADAVANDYFRNRRFIGSGDRRSVSDRVWRVLRSQRRLTWWLALGRMAPTARMLVASSLLTEGWTLDGVGQSFSGGQFGPDTLDQVEKSALRNIEGHSDEHPEMPDAVRLEIPDWILSRLQDRFGDALATEMAAMNAPATLDLRVNLLKGTREAALAALAEEGLECLPTPLSPWGLRIEERRSVTSGPAFQTGLVEIQDEGSQLVAALVDARPEMRVVDYCAGAGGKTLAMAMTMANRGHIVACDVSAPRLDGAVRRLRRAGVHNVEQHLIVSGDKWAKRRAGSFDRVLVDAPCTGTGTWRRNPDARQRLVERDLLELVPKQAMILDAAAGLVRIGGRLIYATCSLLPEENEAQVSAFLSRHPDFVVRPLIHAWRLDTDLPEAENFPSGEFLSLTPLRHGTDGFFGAVLERIGAKATAEPAP
jgi:16S rRNA (cytosine967-C5)-methyltransferase